MRIHFLKFIYSFILENSLLNIYTTSHFSQLPAAKPVLAVLPTVCNQFSWVWLSVVNIVLLILICRTTRECLNKRTLDFIVVFK